MEEPSVDHESAPAAGVRDDAAPTPAGLGQPAVRQRNIRYLYGEVAAWGVTNGIVTTFLAIFALRLGATDQEVGLLSALPALVFVLWNIPAGQLVLSRADVKHTGVIGLFLFRLEYVLIALIPLLPQPYRIPALLLIVVLASIPLVVGNLAAVNLIADAIPPQMRPRVVSNRLLLLSLSSALAAFLGGELLSRMPLPENYQVLFAIAFGFSLASTFLLTKLQIAKITPSGSFSLRPRRFLRQMQDITTTARSSRSFMRFTMAAFTMHWTLVFPGPLFALWWVQGLNITDSWVGVVSTVSLIASILIYPVWGRISERRGNRFAWFAGFAGIVFNPALTAIVPSATLLLIPETIGGICVPGMSLGLFNSMLEASPATDRPAYVAFYSAVVNIPVFVAPILATVVFVPLIGIPATMFFATATRIVSLGIMYALMKGVPRS